MTSPLDDFIPQPDARERFEIQVNAPPNIVFQVARSYDMQSLPVVKAIFWMRARFMGSSAIVRVPQGLVAEMRSLGWGVLREEPGRLFVAGAICQPWLADVRFRSLSPGSFRTHSEPDHVKIGWTLEVTPTNTGGTRFASETRAVATDEAARTRFLRYWRWARFGILPIRWLLLPAVGRRAEAEWRTRGAP